MPRFRPIIKRGEHHAREDIRFLSFESDGIAAVGQLRAGKKVSITYVILTLLPSWRSQMGCHT